MVTPHSGAELGRDAPLPYGNNLLSDYKLSVWILIIPILLTCGLVTTVSTPRVGLILMININYIIYFCILFFRSSQNKVVYRVVI